MLAHLDNVLLSIVINSFLSCIKYSFTNRLHANVYNIYVHTFTHNKYYAFGYIYGTGVFTSFNFCHTDDFLETLVLKSPAFEIHNEKSANFFFIVELRLAFSFGHQQVESSP